MKIFLIGYRCCGKTSIGKIISSKLALSFADTDSDIQQKEEKSIKDIVAENGWAHFRALESATLRDVSSKGNIVISTGGGIIEDEKNIDFMKNNGIVIWLKAKAKTIEKRIIKDENSSGQRPALTGKGLVEEISEVLEKRVPMYEKASSFILDTDDKDLREIALQILNLIKEPG